MQLRTNYSGLAYDIIINKFLNNKIINKIKIVKILINKGPLHKLLLLHFQ